MSAAGDPAHTGSRDVDTFTVRTIEMTWDAGARLAVLRFTDQTHATGEDAARLVDTLSRWVGGDGVPFGLMGDGSKLAGVDAAYRAAWAKFLKDHHEDARIAFFGMNPVIRIAAEMFGLGTGLRLRTFGDEEAARAWLRRNGIAA